MRPIKLYVYTPQEIQLAHEIADALNDQKSLGFYLSCTKKYSHRSLRDTLARIMAMPKEKIYTTRARYFTHLVGQLPKNEVDETDTYDHSWD